MTTTPTPESVAAPADESFCREELIAIRAMIEETIRKPPPDITPLGRVALRLMHVKVTRMIVAAVGMLAS